MRHSSFGALVLLLLAIVVIVLMLTPGTRHSSSTAETPLWGTRR